MSDQSNRGGSEFPLASDSPTTGTKPPKKSGCLLFFLLALIMGGAAIIIVPILLFIFFAPSISGVMEGLQGTVGEFDLGVKPYSKKSRLRETLHSGSSLSSSKIALIPIEGVIMNSKSDWYSVSDSDFICDELYEASCDPKVKAVILYIDSPGGEITATDKIYHYILKVREAGKPVVAFMDSVAASGGYYVAAPADMIIAHKLTTTGSIGVRIDSFKYYELFSKIGVAEEIFKSKEMKDILSGGRPTSPLERQVVQGLIDECYDRFVDVVSQGRIPKNPALTPEHIKSSVIGDGRVFTGSQALELGLIDQIGYYEDAEEKTAELAGLESYKVISYEKNMGFFDILKGLESGSAARSKIKLSIIPGSSRFEIIQPGKIYLLPDFWFQ